jgi:hypothetical protein
MLVKPSWPGLIISIAGFLMFLSRQPLKLAAKDILQRKKYPRTVWALGLGGIELAVALALLAIAMAISSRPLLIPAAVFLTVAAVQFAFDSLGKGRSTFPELIGATAAAILAPIIVLAGGLSDRPAWILGALLALHSALAIVYVGVRLDLAHKRQTSTISIWTLSALTLLAVGAGFSIGLVPWLVLAVFVVLAARAIWGVSPRRAIVKPHFIGIQEIAYTLLLIVVAATASPSS